MPTGVALLNCIQPFHSLLITLGETEREGEGFCDTQDEERHEKKKRTLKWRGVGTEAETRWDRFWDNGGYFLMARPIKVDAGVTCGEEGRKQASGHNLASCRHRHQVGAIRIMPPEPIEGPDDILPKVLKLCCLLVSVSFVVLLVLAP